MRGKNSQFCLIRCFVLFLGGFCGGFFMYVYPVPFLSMIWTTVNVVIKLNIFLFSITDARLQASEAGFKRSYGEKMERLAALKVREYVKCWS